MMVHCSVPRIKIFALGKRILFENGINQIIIKQLKVYSVMLFQYNIHAVTKFQGCVDFLKMVFNPILHKSPSVAHLSRETIGQQRVR